MASMIPETHADLLSDDRPIVAALATLMPDGSPQLTPVWFNWDGEFLRVNTNRSRAKYRNMSARPRVALAVFDPENIYRHLQIRGQVDSFTEQGARQHIDALAHKYTGREFRALHPGEVRVTFKIRPTTVTFE
jgi:PPOX class probable F420-dependent enzyme